jgi:hypothetical protein
MRSGSLFAFCSTLLLASTASAFAGPHVRRGPTAPRAFKAHASRAASKPGFSRVGMAPERATEIQTALIKAGYMKGAPTGTWDAQSQSAMEKLQADNGWQTKLVPDSRAIIKLGLGPTTPSASTAEPHESPSSAPDVPTHTTNQ